MAESWIQKSLVCLMVSMILQLVALATPGWIVSEKRRLAADGDRVYYGLFYIVTCEDGSCTSESVPSFHVEYFRKVVLYRYASTIVHVLLAWILTAAVGGLTLLAVAKRRTWVPAFTSVCMMILAIANTLQWLIVAYFAHVTVVMDPTYSTALFPWCVLLYGVAALLISAVLFQHVKTFVAGQLKPALHDLFSTPTTNTCV